MADSKINLRTQDPIQGHDVIVRATGYGNDRKTDGVGDGAAANDTDNETFQNVFTDIMFKIVNQTETYLSLSSRVPRYLDGEVIIVWSCSAGVLSLKFVRETFGSTFTAGLKSGRSKRIQRANRFTLDFKVATGETISSAAGLENSRFNTQVAANTTMVTGLSLLMCRCDTLSFGVQSGKGYAVNSWQGTAEGIKRRYGASDNSDPVETSTT